MAIAAVPKYLGSDFTSAPPGHRFGMYLRLWGVDARSPMPLWTTHDVNYRSAGPSREERAFKDENKTNALKDALSIGKQDRDTMTALVKRQAAAATVIKATGQLLELSADAIAPFTTGLGNEHPLENGFSFLNPYGLPYLPGSGVKGVLRTAAQELAEGTFGDHKDWNKEACYPLMHGEGDKRTPVLDSKKRPVCLNMLEVLFGTEDDPKDKSKETVPVRGALMFWDVIPDIKGDNLKVEVMTPHQGHYYQQGGTPHESGSPNPINFLTVPPLSTFNFYVQCNRPFLARIAPELAEGDRWKSLIQAAFEHAFEWLGFGAKTAVGYGAMATHAQKQAIAAQNAVANGKPAPVLAAATEIRWEGAELSLDPGSGKLSCTFQGKTAVGHRDKCMMDDDFKTRLKAKKRLKCTLVVEQQGNSLIIIKALPAA